MCKGDKKCAACEGRSRHHVRFEAGGQNWRTETFMGEEFAVLPVVMAKADVVMNGRLFPASEYIPSSWNGVPVVIDHPKDDEGNDLSANTPQYLEERGVGNVFNVTVKNNSLVGEVWISMERIKDISPETLERVAKGQRLDVSVGMLAWHNEKSGIVNGRRYDSVMSGVIPDHLALLPHDEGACSWLDGCGVRNHNRKGQSVTFKELAKRLASAANAKKAVGNVDSGRSEVIDALIANEGSPFTDADRPALEAMTEQGLRACAEACLKPAGNSGTDAPGDDTKKDPAAMSAAGKAIPKKEDNMLSDKDREALAFANKFYDEERAKLVAKIVANSAMTEAQIKGFDMATLTTIANGLKKDEAKKGESKKDDGKPAVVAHADDGNPAVVAHADVGDVEVTEVDDAAKIANGLVSGGVVSFLKNKKKGA